MSAKVLPIEAVVVDPGVRGGRPIVAGTSIRVSDLAAYHTLGGLTPEQLAVQFELDLSQVHAALAYYYRHQADVDAEIRANAEEADRWKQVLAAQGHCLTLG